MWFPPLNFVAAPRLERLSVTGLPALTHQPVTFARPVRAIAKCRPAHLPHPWVRASHGNNWPVTIYHGAGSRRNLLVWKNRRQMDNGVIKLPMATGKRPMRPDPQSEH